MVISEKIRTLRKEAGMSQEELADSIPALEYSKDEKTNLITLNGYCSELTVRK